MSLIEPNVHDMIPGKTSKGGRSFRKQDMVGDALEGWAMEEVLALADAMGIDTSRYEDMTPGNCRMVVGNMFRRRIKDRNAAFELAYESAALPSGWRALQRGDDWFKGLVLGLELARNPAKTP